ncbi:MAG: flagellar biosynthesis protein FlhA [Myxococcales bacterium]|nr:flagellar biosynthesis protein FlhA [Myxococcales bacterium]
MERGRTMRAMRSDMALAIGVMMILGVMVLPMPSILLDLLLALNISLSLTILFSALYVKRSVDFSVFPSMLLLTTLFRLSLNVASTRLILLKGSEGTSAAGNIIQSFGNFVVGGNFVIGLIIFIILIIINFMVITKGSGRIAEVAARFTLDAMPGKQMAIDADLGAGLLTESEARERRKGIEEEANFYGAMDGASKFVRGDAIAGILITAINIAAGFIIGVTQEGMNAADAAQTYTLLTVGDGLVSQIPSLVISAAAGIIVTRAAGRDGLGDSVVRQLFGSRETFITLALSLGVLGIVPGMPLILFWTLAGLSAAVAWNWSKVEQALHSQGGAGDPSDPLSGDAPLLEPPSEEQELQHLLPLNMLELTIGYGLVPLVDEQAGGDILERISGIRRTLAQELGFIIPAVHIRDDLTMDAHDYRVLLKGNVIAEGELLANKMLAIDPGIVAAVIPGIPTTEPAFGLSALWIDGAMRDDAEMAGYTVVEPSAVLATHLSELFRSHASELLGRQETQELVDILAQRNNKLVEELIPQLLSIGDVVQVLRNLLVEQISIRDMRTILETLADHAPHTKDTSLLTEFVRQRLGRSITRKYTDEENILHVVTLDHNAENIFRRGQTPDGGQALDPRLAQNLLANIEQIVQSASNQELFPVLLTAPDLRRQMRTFTERFIPNLAVLSYKEIDPGIDIKAVGAVRV